MTDPVVSGVEADAAKVKSIWTRYEVYIVAVVCLIVGAYIGHHL
jgi:hypothetical protein